MLKWPLSLLSKVGTIALIAYIAWLGWQNLGPRKPGVGQMRKDLLQEVVPKVVEDLRTSRGAIRQAALLHIGNDPSDLVTDSLRTAIEESGALTLADRTVGEKVFNLMNLQHGVYIEQAVALARGQSLGVSAVIFGKVDTFESYPGGAALKMTITLLDVSGGQVVFTREYIRQLGVLGPEPLGDPGPPPTLSFKGGAIWLILVLLLPVFSIGFVRSMVRKDSNRTNAFVLVTYTVVDALLAWLLVGTVFAAWWTILLFVAAIAVALLYNIRVMTFAVQLERD